MSVIKSLQTLCERVLKCNKKSCAEIECGKIRRPEERPGPMYAEIKHGHKVKYVKSVLLCLPLLLLAICIGNKGTEKEEKEVPIQLVGNIQNEITIANTAGTTWNYDIMTRKTTYKQGRAQVALIQKYAGLADVEFKDIYVYTPVKYLSKAITTPVEEVPELEPVTLMIADEESETFNCYIPIITLDYSWETFEMPYSHQEHLWKECKKRGVNYWDMMAIIARESRFNPNVGNEEYWGYMQLADCAEECAEQRMGVDLDKYDVYDNITIGVECFLDALERTNYDNYAAHWSYGSGYWGYLEESADHNVCWFVEKAYRYRNMLQDTILNPRY